MGLLIAVLSAFVLTAVLTRQFCNPTSRLHFLDHPNERSLHTRPTPRTGGVAINVGLFAAAVIGWTYWVDAAALAWLSAASLLVAGISFLDDIKGISSFTVSIDAQDDSFHRYLSYKQTRLNKYSCNFNYLYPPSLQYKRPDISEF